MKRLSLLSPFLLTLACTNTPVWEDADMESAQLGYAGLSILQGPTSETRTILTIVIPKGAQFRYSLKPAEGGSEIKARSERLIKRSYSDWAVQQVSYSRLNKKVRYQFEVTDQDNQILDSRELRTLDTSKRRAIIGAASCMDDSYLEEQEIMWKDLVSHNPDLIFFVGDNVYTDKEVKAYTGPADPKMIWRRYVETRQVLDIYKIRTLIPVFATWDDHDYGKNDGDASFAHRQAATNVFKAFFPLGSLEAGPGVSSTFNAFGQKFFLLDDRTFRSPNRSQGGVHLGKTQVDWLIKKLQGAITPAWLINGNQFFGSHYAESFEGSHNEAFKRFTKKLARVTAPVLFLSGDRHFAQLQRIPKKELGYPTYELTTSPIHGLIKKGIRRRKGTPYRILSKENVVNYAVIETEISARRLHLNINVFGPGKKLLFSRKGHLDPKASP